MGVQVYAVIDGAGLILNMVEWDGATPWQPPVGTSIVASDGTAAIGGSYINGIFTPPPQQNTGV